MPVHVRLQNMNRKRDDSSVADGDRSRSTASTRLEAAAKPLLAIVGLIVAGALLGLVPTLDSQLPGTPVTVEAAVVGVLAVVAFGLVVVAATTLEAVVAEHLSTHGDVAPAAGDVAKYLTVFLGLVAVYAPVTRALFPFLRETDAAGVFDLGYTVAALALLVAVGVVVYRYLDELAAIAVVHLGTDPVDQSVAPGAGDAPDEERGAN